VPVQPAHAITAIPTPNPIPGSYGLEATKTQPPPTQAGSIATPAAGASFTSSPISMNGICQDGLLVEAYDNNVLVGSVVCSGGSYSLQVSLFVGSNDLSVIMYDSLDQAGPASNISTVTYTNAQFSAFGQQLTLTSSYGRRSSPANTELSWPLQLSGGTGPYAFSIDWGDGSQPELKSQPVSGDVKIAHTYAKAGIYQVSVKVTDVNGVSAFIQLVAVSSGEASGTSSTTGNNTSPVVQNKVLWLPAVVSTVLLLPAYWAGRRSQLVSIRNKLLKDRDNYEKK